MREIKFRYWDKENNEMINADVLAFEEYLPIADHLNQEGIMQYTGMKDVNGVEIYEGDLVEHEMEVNGVWEEYQASPVVYDEEYAMFCFEHDAPNNLADYRNLKVVGNIFESK